jgi:chemotaxis protein CheD
MNPRGVHLPKRHLQPGQLLITRKPQWVLTLLGSCVAVTMFNARVRLAAICHAMLPQPHCLAQVCSPPLPSFRYVSHALPAMIEQFTRAGVSPEETEVKLFGGGNVIQTAVDHQEDRAIGSSNVVHARRFLQVAKLQIRAQNVGGIRGRKIAFNTLTGEVLHRHL